MSFWNRSRAVFVPLCMLLAFSAVLGLGTGCNRGLFGDAAPICERVAVPEDMRCIPGGAFVRGSDRVSVEEDTGKPIRDEGPPTRISISAFFLDTTEVRYSDYQACVRADDCTPAGPNYRGYSNPDQPMLGLTWFQARQFCQARGKRLPSEAEWEFAARGPESETFPWGEAPINCERAVIQENGEKGCGRGTTWQVASRPAERYGLYDMAGNSWEWVNDWYSEDYASCGAACEGEDPRGPCNGADDCPGHARRIVKGGSWWWDGEFAESSNRRAHFPQNKPFHHYGFRCAKSIPRQD